MKSPKQTEAVHLTVVNKDKQKTPESEDATGTHNLDSKLLKFGVEMLDSFNIIADEDIRIQRHVNQADSNFVSFLLFLSF